LYAHLAQWEQAIEQCEKAVAVIGVGIGAGLDTCNQCQTFIRLGDSGPRLILVAAYAWAGHDKEARETASRLREISPYYSAVLPGVIQANAEYQDDPTYRAQMARIIEGLRKAGLSE
jgi:hypothetical protein